MNDGHDVYMDDSLSHLPKQFVHNLPGTPGRIHINFRAGHNQHRPQALSSTNDALYHHRRHPDFYLEFLKLWWIYSVGDSLNKHKSAPLIIVFGDDEK